MREGRRRTEAANAEGGESLLGRWEAAEESVLVVVGDHSLAPPRRRLIQGFCRSFSGALLGGVIPVGLQRASLFIWGWPSRQVAGALWSCQGEGTSFPGEGTPSSSYLHRGFLLEGQSGTGQCGDNPDMGFNSPWPHGFLWRSDKEGLHHETEFNMKTCENTWKYCLVIKKKTIFK